MLVFLIVNWDINYWSSSPNEYIDNIDNNSSLNIYSMHSSSRMLSTLLLVVKLQYLVII
jgi:hypothetical protein